MIKSTKKSEILDKPISENGIIPETNIKKEDLLKDLDLIFSYARSYVATTNPLDENVMIGIIKIKKVLIDIVNKDT